MEGQRNEYSARGGICLRPTLVLVSGVPDSDAEWHDNLVLPAGFYAIAGSHGRAQHVFGDRRGMAAFRDYAARISTGELGREAAFRKRILRCRHGRLRANRSDWEIRFANLRRRIAIPDNSAAGHRRLRLVSETHPGQNGHQFRIGLWNPFLKSSGG